MARLLRRLHTLLRWRQQERDLHDELTAHVAMDAQERIDAGESPEIARHAARRDFGNVARVVEDTRAAWGWTGVEQVLQDLRYACPTAPAQSGVFGRRDRDARRGHRRHDRGVQRPASGAARAAAVRSAGPARALLPAGARRRRRRGVSSPVHTSRRCASTRHRSRRSRRSPTTPRPAAISSRTGGRSGSACCGSRATTSTRSDPARCAVRDSTAATRPALDEWS